MKRGTLNRCLVVGDRVWSSLRGYGIVKKVDEHDDDEPYLVKFTYASLWFQSDGSYYGDDDEYLLLTHD